MQTNTGNIGNKGNVGGSKGDVEWSNAPFVKRFEMAAMQLVILSKAQQGEVTRDNLQQTFRGNLQMSGEHFDHCLTQLIQDGHLKEIGGDKYAITDDGREDVQKLVTLVHEIPSVVGQGGQTQRQGMAQTQSPRGGNVGGGNVGTTGNVGQQNLGQPKGGPGSSSR